MSLNSETSLVKYVGNNSTVDSYTVPFLFLQNSDLRVVMTTPDGIDIPLTLGSQFTASGAGNENGGSVLTVLPWSNSYQVTIYREVAATQATVYAENADFPASSHERALDKLTMIAQQLRRMIGQAIRFRASDSSTGEVAKVGNSLFGLDPAGQPLFRTADEVASFLNLSQQYFDRPTKTFANDAERGAAVPDFIGQLGTQRDTRKLYIGTALTAGSWALDHPTLEAGDVGTSILADGALSADVAGRAKMADSFLTLAKIGAGIFTSDATGRGKFANGFVDSGLCAAGLWNAIAPTGAVLQTVYAEFTTNANLTATITMDTSVPTNSSGTEIITASITPLSASNKILVEWSWMGTGNADSTLVSAFFKNSTTTAFFASANSQTANFVRSSSCFAFDTAGATTSQTYRIRVGPGSASTWRLNGSASGNYFGAATKCTLKISEIKA